MSTEGIFYDLLFRLKLLFKPRQLFYYILLSKVQGIQFVISYTLRIKDANTIAPTNVTKRLKSS